MDAAFLIPQPSGSTQGRPAAGTRCVGKEVRLFSIKIVCQTVRDIRTGDTRNGTQKKRSNIRPHGY